MKKSKKCQCCGYPLVFDAIVQGVYVDKACVNETCPEFGEEPGHEDWTAEEFHIYGINIESEDDDII